MFFKIFSKKDSKIDKKEGEVYLPPASLFFIFSLWSFNVKENVGLTTLLPFYLKNKEKFARGYKNYSAKYSIMLIS